MDGKVNTRELVSEGGVCYMDYPAPSVLYRAAKQKHAQMLISDGVLYLRNWVSYRNAEDGPQKDAKEGFHEFQYCGAQIAMNVENAAFLWCATTICEPDILFNQWPKADTIICITDPAKLFTSANAVCPRHGIYGVFAGHVQYDRGYTVSAWPEFTNAVFQKGKEFAYQNEYRFALVANVSPNCAPLLEVRLELDRMLCGAIISIVAER